VYQRGPRNWWIKWREGGRIRYAHGYETKELAEQVRAKIVADIQAGRAGLPADQKGTPTLALLAPNWLTRRELTNRDVKKDKLRWKNHLGPFFGPLKPGEIDRAKIRAFVEAKLAQGLNSATIVRCVHLLSSLYEDLIERGVAQANPVRALPRSIRRLLRPTFDPRSTPFIERLDDVKRIYQALPEPIGVAFAIGAFGGLRTAEVLGLDWKDVNLAATRIHVRHQVNDGRLAVLKDDESRIVPILRPLAPILAAWKLRTGGEGLLFKPACPTRGGREGRPPSFMRPHTLHRHLARALAACELSTLTWYQATRHTFASQWVLAGGSIEKLKEIMGHSSVVVTERYAHLKPELFRAADYELLNVDLASDGQVVQLPGVGGAEKGAIGYAVVTDTQPTARRQVANAGKFWISPGSSVGRAED
jgi:integrase